MAQIGRYATSLLCLLAVPGFAQSAPWQGWYLGLNLNRATTATEFGGASIHTTLGGADANVTLQGGHVLALGPQARLDLGLTFDLGDLTAGRMPLGGSELDFRLREMYAVHVAPGYALNPSTLLYAKLAYLGARGEERLAGDAASKTYAGLGYGLGLRLQLTPQLYLQAQYLHADYEWKGSRSGAFRPLSTSGSVGLGWRF